MVVRGPEVEVVLAQARTLVDRPAGLESAIATLESLQHRLDSREDQALGHLRSRLASHLVTLHAVREADASWRTVARVIRRAIDDVEDRLTAATAPLA